MTTRDRVNQARGRRCAPTHPRNTGFTLVELMVVIIVIAILMGLLIPALGGAVTAARNAAIGLEIGQIVQGLERYKLEYGEYPPDFSMDDGDAGNTADRQFKRDAISAHVSRSFRYRQSSGMYTPPNVRGDLLTGEDLDALNPSTALHFWLRGFSANPQFPVTDAATTRTAMFSFDQSRVIPAYAAKGPLVSPYREDGRATVSLNRLYVEGTNNQLGDAAMVRNLAIATYHPQGAETDAPYLYYRANVTNAPNSDAFAYATARAWAERIGPAPRPYMSDNMVPAAAANSYASPKTFQLICAGLDGVYGFGGTVNNGGLAVAGAYTKGPYPAASHYEDRDNLANFTEGSTLEDAQP